MRFLRLAGMLAVVFMSQHVFAQLQVEDTGGKPFRRKIIITSPGVYKAEVWQASGGGIMGFYDLAADPESKVNLAGDTARRGLFEIGWHGRRFKGPDPADQPFCCVRHMRQIQAGKEKDKQGCYDGCADWPSGNRQRLKAWGTLDLFEKSPARVRVRARSTFVWWGMHDHKNLKVAAEYTFYPTGKIAVQVHVQNDGKMAFHWGGEYGPHLMVPGSDKKPEVDLGFVWSTPKQEISGTRGGGPSEELFLATSKRVKASLMLTIPREEHKLFSRAMRHNGRGIGWDRCGYGSEGITMNPGYDNTWACMIQMGTPGSALSAEMKTAAEALPYAMQYREPAELTGVTLVTDEAGDLNKDGYNESEGCHVLKGPGPLSFTYEKGKGAGFAPAFKVTGWKGDAPKTLKVDGRDVPVAGGVVNGKLIVQVLGTVPGPKATLGIGN